MIGYVQLQLTNASLDSLFKTSIPIVTCPKDQGPSKTTFMLEASTLLTIYPIPIVALVS